MHPVNMPPIMSTLCIFQGILHKGNGILNNYRIICFHEWQRCERFVKSLNKKQKALAGFLFFIPL
jgi:hypothetical protein